VILVTGATGFVGRRFVTRQLAAGRHVRALVRPQREIPFRHALLDWRAGDITDRDSLAPCFAGVRTVVHLAALVASPDEALNEKVNAEGTRTLLQLSRLNRVDRFVFMSAAAAKFRRTNAYGRSKRRAEEIVAGSGLDYAIVRAPLIIGPGGEEWTRFVDYLRKVPGLVPVFGDGKAIKQPIHVDDLVTALERIVAREPLGNRIWEVPGPDRITLDRFIDLTGEKLGLRKRKVHIPLTASLALARIAEALLGPRSPLTRDIVHGINADVDFDAACLAELGLSPAAVGVAIEQALTRSR
jgi:NADH dehydrogenase